jgi:FemAB-related protein (PEP-CTERM system-associated)
MDEQITTHHRAKIRIVRSQPELNGAWSDTLAQVDRVNLGQLPQWYRVIQEAYDHTPLYIAGETEAGDHAVLPAFLIRSPLFGGVVTSMPFLDSGGPCSSSSTLSQILVTSLLNEAAKHGAHRIELRCTAPMDLPTSPVGDKVNMSLKLPNDPDRLWQKLDSKVRNQIRKAERSGLSIEVGGGEKLREFYEPFVHNMRDLGSPVHALTFFQAIFKMFENKAHVVLVRKDAQPIGGLITLEFKDSIIVPWASSLREYLSLCPNMLLYWETLRSSCLAGISWFHFGRSSRNSGTYRFKRQWGAVEEPLFWYTFHTNAHPSEQSSLIDRRAALLSNLWQRLPLGLTRWLGPQIRKYLTQ